jgi:hypothetical protein
MVAMGLSNGRDPKRARQKGSAKATRPATPQNGSTGRVCHRYIEASKSLSVNWPHFFLISPLNCCQPPLIGLAIMFMEFGFVLAVEIVGIEFGRAL